MTTTTTNELHRCDWYRRPATEHGGWHNTRIHAPSSVLHGERGYEVTWRTQHRRCCGRDLIVADAGTLPVRGIDEHGDLMTRTVQCGSCGTIYAARYTSWRHAYPHQMTVWP